MARHFSRSTAEFLDVAVPDTFTGSVSFSYWYYHDTLPGSGYPNRQAPLYCGGGGGTIENFIILHDSTSGAGIQMVWTVGSANYQALSAPNTFDIGTWHHVLIATDYTAANHAVYLDGVPLTITGSVTGPPDTGVTEFNIGAIHPTAEGMDGRLADIAIWSGVRLGPAEARALAKGARPNTIRPGSLLRWWPLDGIQTPEPDLGSGGFNNASVGYGSPSAAAGPPLAMFTPRWPGFFSSSGGGSTTTISAAPGSFTLTGEPAALKQSLALAAGSFSLTGEPATITVGVFIPAAPGSFTLTGEPAALKQSLAFAPGSFSLTGEPASINVGLFIAAAPGSFTLTGQPAAFKQSLGFAPGSFSYAGGGASITVAAPTIMIAAGPGSFTLTGEPAVIAQLLAAAPGNLVIAGKPATFLGWLTPVASTEIWTPDVLPTNPWTPDSPG
jgi:Concanavalin A-like lectin/glucanases superfamily